MSRPYNTTTKLGQQMAAQGWSAGDFAAMTGINPRTLTEYLSGRRQATVQHLWAMADVLGVDAEEIDG